LRIDLTEFWFRRPVPSRGGDSHSIGQAFAICSRMNKHDETVQPGLQKDPDDWKTGDEPMTASQRSYLETLARDNDETVDENLTKAEASKRIDELRERSPRLSGE
jgi:hypothetical protein